MKEFQFNEPLYVSSSVDLAIISSLSALIIFVNGKYLKDMNEDDRNRLPGTPRSLINDVMVTRTKGAFILPPYYLLSWFLSQGYLLPEWFYQMIIYEQYLVLFLRFYFPFTSFIIASMRYVFIVHDKKIVMLALTVEDEKEQLILYRWIVSWHHCHHCFSVWF